MQFSCADFRLTVSPVYFSQLFLTDNPTVLLQETLDENQAGLPSRHQHGCGSPLQ